jgi:hypothetical protein
MSAEEFAVEKALEYQFDHVKEDLQQTGDDIHNGEYLQATSHGLDAYIDSMPGVGLAHSLSKDVSDWATHALSSDDTHASTDGAVAPTVNEAPIEDTGYPYEGQDVEYG